MNATDIETEDSAEPTASASGEAPCARRSPLSLRAAWAGGEAPISRLMARTLDRPELISLAAGFVDPNTLPVGPTLAALKRLTADEERLRAALQYGTTIGLSSLRRQLAERLIAADGRDDLDPDELAGRMVLSAGSNPLLFLISDALLDPSDIVLCAAPSYFVYLGLAGGLGARAVGVESDDDGIVPEAVEDELRRRNRLGEGSRVKAIYVTSYYDNPAGRSISARRRDQLIEIARRWSREQTIFLLEDAAYRELRYEGDDEPSLWSRDSDGSRTAYVGTFSKSFSPGIRVGWAVLPPQLFGPVTSQTGHMDFGSPTFNQYLVDTVLREGLYDPHVETLRQSYRGKLDVMIEVVAEHLGPLGARWSRPRGGLYLWVELPEGIDTGLNSSLFQRALDEGVLYIPGELCYPSEGVQRPAGGLRLCFGIPSIRQICDGVAALGRAIKREQA